MRLPVVRWWAVSAERSRPFPTEFVRLPVVQWDAFFVGNALERSTVPLLCVCRLCSGGRLLRNDQDRSLQGCVRLLFMLLPCAGEARSKSLWRGNHLKVEKNWNCKNLKSVIKIDSFDFYNQQYIFKKKERWICYMTRSFKEAGLWRTETV